GPRQGIVEAPRHPRGGHGAARLKGVVGARSDGHVAVRIRKKRGHRGALATYPAPEVFGSFCGLEGLSWGMSCVDTLCVGGSALPSLLLARLRLRRIRARVQHRVVERLVLLVLPRSGLVALVVGLAPDRRGVGDSTRNRPRCGC